jgi:hypothetical protein
MGEEGGLPWYDPPKIQPEPDSGDSGPSYRDPPYMNSDPPYRDPLNANSDGIFRSENGQGWNWGYFYAVLAAFVVVGLIAALVGGVNHLPLVTAAPAPTATTGPVPVITSVNQVIPYQHQTIVIAGYRFGTMQPYDGDSDDLQIQDNTHLWEAGWNHCHNGCSDWIGVVVSSWTDTMIVITGFDGSYGNEWSLHTCDHVAINIWNPQTGAGPGQISLVVTAGPMPVISAVSRIATARNQTISITGHGFGSMQPYAGDSNDLQIQDTSHFWEAGWNHCTNDCSDWVGLVVSKWTDTKIVITGFDGYYGGEWAFRPGDAIIISIWNAQTGYGPGQFTATVSG